MDWKGQRLAEELLQYMLVATGVVAFLLGYFKADFKLMMMVFGGGAALTGILVLFDWPWYNRNSLKWLDANTAAEVTSKPFNKGPDPAAPTKTSKKSKGQGQKN